MNTFFWGNLVFFFFFLLHLAAWQVHLPRRQTKALLLILFGGLALSLALFLAFPSATLFCFPVPAGPELVAVALYVTSFILAYMITYSAVEADSPTLVMIKAVADAGPAGLRRGDFYAAMSDGVLVEPRLRDLLTDRMAVLENGRYVLTGKGRLFSAIFSAHRALLGLGKGG